MKKYILTLSLLSSYLLAEPSVFGAGDLDSSNPYGLSESEKHILKNKNAITDLTKRATSLSLNVKSIEEKVEGLKSVVEGQNKFIGDFKSELTDLKKSIDIVSATNEDKLKNLEDKINSILVNFESSYNKQSVDINSSFNTLTIAIDKITKTLNSVYSNYIPKDELNKHLKGEFDRFQKDILKEVNSYLKSNQKDSTKVVKKETILSTLASEESGKILIDAKKLYEKKELSDSKVRFKLLIDRNYKPATSNYYLGEIAYSKGEYSSALEYYKKSVGLYDKASYMPNLLLHSAISCEKIKDIANAKSFYNALIAGFEKSDEAKIAKENLKKIK